jgi:serine/threonine protein kinase
MNHATTRTQELGGGHLAGKYRLIAELGQGGMATVFLAVMLGGAGFRKLAVVKLLRPELAVDTDFVQMFLDEARLSARLSHPNIVQTYDVGVDSFGHLMAMEYLDGVSLHAALSKLRKSGTPLKFPLHARVLLDVLQGLQYAHSLVGYDGQSLAIVHRDISPQNIFVTYDGQVKLLDFGIAKAATSSVHTATGVIKGKLTYMAPEQARGDEVDARSDLYAVGVMLWEAVTGRRRWPGGLSQPALFLKMATGELPESPDSASHGYPAALDDVVMKSLAPKPQDRYQTAAEFYDALEAIVRTLEPAPLRELASILSGAFADGRQKMKILIEEQFRLIESGRPPSGPHQVPRVAVPSMVTGSEVFDIPVDIDEGGGRRGRLESSADAATYRPPRPTESTATEAKPTESTPIVRSRSRTVIIGAGIVAAIAVIIIVAQMRKNPVPVMAPVAEVPAPSQENHPALATADVATTSLPPEQVPARVEPAAPTRRADAHGRTVSVAPARNPATRASATPEPAATPTATTAPTANDPAPVPLHIQPGKPKVQLERDNPWP